MTSLASRRSLRVLAVLVLLAVPLAVVGLFAGALSQVGSDDGRVPAAIVNEDEMIEQTAEDGTTTPVLAGRLLVTELTGDGDRAAGFDWRLTNAAEAEDALSRGEVYAVLTIPSDFSAAVTSLSTPDPVRGTISVRTDDAHGYLVGPITDAIGDGLAAAFGTQISEQFISGLVGGTGQFKDAFTTAAEAAAQVADGSRGLSDGVSALRDGATATQQGAAALADGVASYTGGVSALSTGISRLRDQTAGLQQLPRGVTDYTNGIRQLSEALAVVSAGIAVQAAAPPAAPVPPAPPTDPAAPPAPPAPPAIDPALVQQLQEISANLTAAADRGPALVTGAQGAAAAQSGIATVASGASTLAANGGGLAGAAGSLRDGLGQLVTGLQASATGASTLATGTADLSTALSEGANQVPAYTDEQAEQVADVASSPIALEVARAHRVDDVPAIASTLLVPGGLWVGAFAAFLALGLFSRRILASTASNLRITSYALVRAGAIVLAQAVLLIALLHGLLGVPWSSVPATLPFAVLFALTVTCIHAFLTAAFGRWGLVLSLLLLALQLTATGGLYPIEVLPAPFQAISPYLPITQALDGLQSIVTGAGPAPVISAALGLAAWAVGTAALTVFAVSRKRSARYLGLTAPAPAPAPTHAHVAV
ncbi:YhgE/Pip domain-containing protein [Naasia sp. SYSU D00057]|uniref:YhgE/Pip domain-containing protein n=1 Tax=Naasia sp. SYSU D00057 TaxID=2817380 RepID=UPI001B312D46|nr:YhgE/Pip family protein [Naasia sp. SYSU D00057]